MISTHDKIRERLSNKQWRVIFYPAYESLPEVYCYWDKELAIQQFNYFYDTRNDADYPLMYKKIELVVVVDKIFKVVDSISF